MPLRVKVTGTTSATAGTETTHAHTLGAVPDFVSLTPKANGTLYWTTAPDATNIYLKSSGTSTPFEALVTIDHTLIK